jgi:hypothetical protein
MKIIFNLIISFCSFSCVAQNYINQSFDYQNQNSSNAFVCLATYGDTIFCIGGNRNDSNKLTVNICLYDLAVGNLLSTKRYQSSKYNYYNGGIGQNINVLNNSIYIFGARKEINNTNQTDGLLFKYSKDADSILIKEYVDSTLIGIACMQSFIKKGRLFVDGYLVSYDSLYNHETLQLFIMETDTNGNILNNHVYGYPHSMEGLSGFIQSHDGGYFLIGSVRDEGQWLQNYLVKTDSLGNMLWQRKWGSLYDDELYDLHELSNGNLLLTGYTSTDIYMPRACITIMNSNATQQLSQQLHLNSLNNYVSFTRIFPNNNGSYDVWGFEETGDITRPFLLKLNSNFDSIDFHYYSYWNEGFQPVNVLRDIVRLSDSGYVACGFGWDQYSSQDAWLLGIDKDGCANVNCTPLNISKSNASTFQIYPNPANDKLQVSSDESIKQCLFYDISGKVIMTLDSFQGSRNIDVSNFSDGLYLLKIQLANGEERSKRISIVH